MDRGAMTELLDALQAHEIVELDDEHKVLVCGKEVVDLREFMPEPVHVEQSVELLNSASLVAYVNRYHRAESAVFANETTGHYEAVIDYHDERRGKCQHRANYLCPPSESWKQWTGSHQKWFAQVEFAEFIERNLRDIAEPTGASLLQVALQLRVHKSAEFQSEVRLDNGQQRLRYEETIRGANVAGDLEVPTDFRLVMPVFVDGGNHAIEARFRYRMDGGKLALGYELIRHMDVWREAVKRVTEEIQKGMANVPLYVGVRR